MTVYFQLVITPRKTFAPRKTIGRCGIVSQIGRRELRLTPFDRGVVMLGHAVFFELN